MSVILNFHNVNDAFHWQICAIKLQMKVNILLWVQQRFSNIYKRDSAPKNTDVRLTVK